MTYSFGGKGVLAILHYTFLVKTMFLHTISASFPFHYQMKGATLL